MSHPSKNILITGAARRIGASCVRLLHDRGHNICLHYHHSEADSLALVQELNASRPGSATRIKADLQKLTDIRQLASQALAQWGEIDVLINNASAFFPGDIKSTCEQDWDKLFNTNLKAPFFLAQALLPTLISRQGCIINIIDIHAERGLKGYPVYSITKAGLAAMTRSLAKELGPDVRVNGISPGAILWPENTMDAATQAEIVNRIALQRSGTPLDIARTVRFFIEEGDYITGQILAIDGGRTLFN
jgi:pteridine reductase